MEKKPLPALYEIEDNLLVLDQLLTEREGDVSDDDGKALEKWFQEYQLAERQKVDNIGHYVASLEALESAIDDEIVRLSRRATAVANKTKRLKEYIKSVMEARRIVKAEGDMFTISVQKNGGKPPLIVRVKSVDELPPRFVRESVVKEIDKDKLRQAIEVGDKEAQKWAEIGTVGTSLRIR
jgi:hypothetical protein